MRFSGSVKPINQDENTAISEKGALSMYEYKTEKTSNLIMWKGL